METLFLINIFNKFCVIISRVKLENVLLVLYTFINVIMNCFASSIVIHMELLRGNFTVPFTTYYWYLYVVEFIVSRGAES